MHYIGGQALKKLLHFLNTHMSAMESLGALPLMMKTSLSMLKAIDVVTMSALLSKSEREECIDLIDMIAARIIRINQKGLRSWFWKMRMKRILHRIKGRIQQPQKG
jgi:hypothetical protein